ncbi:hypothetical protein Pmar_PMAR019701 [Perkinsus marinus ATCC 50983]|uniref:Palmitoyltransferase n=1 Tax=Perkinsus marinus (strain ATCC 50983 / TXsc) TaxID=423536 RepID=C5LVY8_PERM5|nr:hypothetical protein Pmar_PMAR019701 [Perkinsus marinus ATCC 50983]EEQ99058.1 hypothetical protein Pmar_PMAR019701 [Perkinsus marinus ATCC 50983]|eukprot:XP_002766341.1 hypothetical protein Pmar_PMAR019701 [Perkinsus marinus ATCC 50983]
MDHHCDVTGNCVGARNQGSFILVFIFGSAACVYAHFCVDTQSCAGGATLMLLATFGALIALAFMFWGQCGQIMRNVTFLEKRPYKAE